MLRNGDKERVKVLQDLWQCCASYTLGRLFSTKSLNSGLAERLSKVADVPVAPDDGLTQFICEICNRKLLSAESFIRTAKASYEKNKASPSGSDTGDTMGSQAQITRKRTKDTKSLGLSYVDLV